MHFNTAWFFKFFIPLLAVVTAGYFCIIYMLGWRPAKNHPAPPPVPNAEIPVKSTQSTPEEEKKTPPPARKLNAPVAPYNFSKVRGLPKKPFAKLLPLVGSGIVVDLNTRNVLWEKNSRNPVPIASLTKLMTALLVMEAIDNGDGQLNWGSVVSITSTAEKVERSCVLGLKKNEHYAIGELMAATLINSHNDAAAMLAEIAAGSVDDFVLLMQKRASELGLFSAAFNSPNGLPQGKKRLNSLCSASDVTRICEILMNYPQVMSLCQMTSKRLHTGKTVYSHNNLLKRKPVPGMIGFKTGFTNKAGFCLAFGVTRENRTVIGCVTGFRSAKERDIFCRELIKWSFKTR